LSVLIKDADWIITQNAHRETLRGYSLLVEDGKITRIGRRVAEKADRVIEGHGRAVLPGLINTHTHLSMTLLRGYADDMHLKEWLEEKIWPLERKLTGDLCHRGALLGCLEMIKTGTTCFLDMYFFTEDVARAAADAGIRAFVSHAIIDLFDKDKREEEKALAERSVVAVKKLNNPRVKIAISPHAPYSCSEESLLAAKELALREGAPLHTHLAETRKEQADFEKKYGEREVEHLEKIGFLGSNLVAAHCVWLTKQEIAILAKHGVKVSHCPVSSMKLGEGGVAPLPELFDHDVTVSLGTDGAASNNCLDMFDTMKICALIHKAHRWDPTVLSAQKTLDLATVEAAETLGISDRVGSIEEGKEADLILLDLKTPNMQPIHGEKTVLSDIVYSAKGHDVATTIVRGELLMQDRKVLSLNEDQVYEAVRAAAEQLTRG